MLKPEFSGQFKRDYKLAIKRGCDPKKLEEVITLLCNEQPLPEAYRDHALTNSRNYKDIICISYTGLFAKLSSGRIYDILTFSAEPTGHSPASFIWESTSSYQ